MVRCVVCISEPTVYGRGVHHQRPSTAPPWVMLDNYTYLPAWTQPSLSASCGRYYHIIYYIAPKHALWYMYKLRIPGLYNVLPCGITSRSCVIWQIVRWVNKRAWIGTHDVLIDHVIHVFIEFTKEGYKFRSLTHLIDQQIRITYSTHIIWFLTLISRKVVERWWVFQSTSTYINLSGSDNPLSCNLWAFKSNLTYIPSYIRVTDKQVITLLHIFKKIRLPISSITLCLVFIIESMNVLNIAKSIFTARLLTRK